MRTFFKLFACCIPVRGYSRSVICDVQRNVFEYIPNLFQELLMECRQLSKDELQEHYAAEDFEGITKFLDYLVRNEYGFWTTCPEEFPDLNLQWQYPGTVSNAILEYHTRDSNYDLPQVLQTLEQLGCRYIQLRVFGEGSAALLASLSEMTSRSAFKVMEVLLPYWEGLDWQSVFDLMKTNHRFIPLSLYACPEDSFNPDMVRDDPFLTSRLNISTATLQPGQIKEDVGLASFTINVDFLSEAQGFNTGLNKKVCIDTAGNIKNHISHETVYGNAATADIAAVVGQLSFQRKWHVSNDKIETCKDCEYRYMCLNNSDLVYEEDTIRRKDACPYDPYTQTWATGVAVQPLAG